MDVLTCMISEKAYREKPHGGEVARLRKSFVTYRGTVETLARRIAKGHPFMCATVKGGFRSDCWTGQQLLALDFDNKEAVLQSRAALGRAALHGIPAAICYESYSSTPAHERFRLVFALDERVTDPKLALSLQRRLLTLFPEADQACSDLARMFYGTSKKVVAADVSAPVERLLALDDPADAAPEPPAAPRRRKFVPSGASGDRVDAADIKRDADLLGMATLLTDAATFKIGNVVYFPGQCPICGHNDCFRYFDNNTWHCFSASNRTGFTGGSVIDFVMAVNGLPDDAEGFKCALSLLAANRG